MPPSTPPRHILILGYALFLLLVGAAVILFPLFWITLALSATFLYVACLFMIHFIELKRETIPIITKWPSISIIVPAYNRGAALEKCIHHIKEMEYPGKKQIIVVNDGSSDKTKELLAKTKGIVTLNLEKNSGRKAFAVNAGIQKATGELIAVVDGDSYPNADCLLRMVPHFFKDKQIGSVTSIVRVNNRTGILQKIQEIEYAIGFGLYNVVLSSFDSLFVTPGPLSIYRREALQKAGGFDTHVITEDMEITFHLHQMGYSLALEQDAHVYSDVPETISALFHQRMRWFRGGIETAYKYRAELFSSQKIFFRFFFPMRLALEFVTLVFFLLIVRMSYETILTASTAFASLYTISFEIIPLPEWRFTATAFYYLLTTIVTLCIVIFGANTLQKDKPSLSMPALFLFLFVYGFFIAGIYVLSLTKLIIGVKNKW